MRKATHKLHVTELPYPMFCLLEDVKETNEIPVGVYDALVAKRKGLPKIVHIIGPEYTNWCVVWDRLPEVEGWLDLIPIEPEGDRLSGDTRVHGTAIPVYYYILQRGTFRMFVQLTRPLEFGDLLEIFRDQVVEQKGVPDPSVFGRTIVITRDKHLIQEHWLDDLKHPLIDVRKYRLVEED